MRAIRIFQNVPMTISESILLDKETSHRLKSVLRLVPGQKITLFNGDGFEYQAVILNDNKSAVSVQLFEKAERNFESPIEIHLGQVISKGEKMDFVIQKATELGVNKITPLFSERSVVHLKEERLDKRKTQWQKIAIQAAEQCGRTIVPSIEDPKPLSQWINDRKEAIGLVLNPLATISLKAVAPSTSYALLIGPEGGLSEAEIMAATNKNFTAIHLGPRILRTETAALATITAIQYLAGDLCA